MQRASLWAQTMTLTVSGIAAPLPPARSRRIVAQVSWEQRSERI